MSKRWEIGTCLYVWFTIVKQETEFLNVTSQNRIHVLALTGIFFSLTSFILKLSMPEK